MFTSFTVKNFRCFQDLALCDCGPVNLIAGRNNTGKTALLEAIRLHCAADDPSVFFTTRAIRGGTEAVRSLDNSIGWLFHDRKTGEPFRVFSCSRRGECESVVSLEDASTFQHNFPEIEQQVVEHFRSDLWDVAGPRLFVRFFDVRRAEHRAVAVQGTHGAVPIFSRRSGWRPACGYVEIGRDSDGTETYFLFGKVETEKRQGEILPVLQIVEPRLTRLAMAPFTVGTVLHGDVGLSRLVPVALMGEGLRSLLSMVLAIANSSGGVVLIDEIENGLHYSVLTEIWHAVAVAAREHNVQIFATTHSWECIRAAHEAFSKQDSYDLRLHRLDRTNGDISAVGYDREMIEASLHSGLEMR